MALFPDPATARLDPFRKHKTLNMNFFVHDPITRRALQPRPAQRRPQGRGVPRRRPAWPTPATSAPRPSSTSSTPSGSSSEPHETFHHIDSVEGWWNTGRDEAGGNLGYKVAVQGRLLPGPAGRPLRRPARRHGHQPDRNAASRSSAATTRSAPRARPRSTTSSTRCCTRPTTSCCSSTSSRTRRGTPARPSPSCRSRCSATTARACTPTSRCGRTASRCSTTRPATAACRTLARYYIGGLLHHAPSLLAFTNPTVNSYHRLVPGFEAPVNLVYSARNRSACIRIPLSGNNPKAKRLEFRCPDSSGNPYLAFAAMMMAGMDGIKNKIEPPAPIDKDLYELPPEEAKDIPQVPGQPAPRSSTGSRRTTTTCSRAACSPRPDRDLDRPQARRTRSTRCGCARTRTSSRCTTTSEIDSALTCG